MERRGGGPSSNPPSPASPSVRPGAMAAPVGRPTVRRWVASPQLGCCSPCCSRTPAQRHRLATRTRVGAAAGRLVPAGSAERRRGPFSDTPSVGQAPALACAAAVAGPLVLRRCRRLTGRWGMWPSQGVRFGEAAHPGPVSPGTPQRCRLTADTPQGAERDWSSTVRAARPRPPSVGRGRRSGWPLGARCRRLPNI